MAGLLDWGSLEPAKDSFVDPHLEAYFSDLLFKAYFQGGRLGYVYFLFEHKSSPEPLVAFHLLRYMVKIWELSLERKDEPGFPVIIPLVLYHGKGSWRPGVNFRDLFAQPAELTSFVPDFRYLLWDASRYSDEEIQGQVLLRVALLLLKYIFREDLRERVAGIVGLLRELSGKQTGLELLETVLRYLLSAAPEGSLSYEELKRAVEEALSYQGGESMRTIADSLIEQGMQKGIEQGIQQGVQQGMQQGMLQSAREAVLEVLEARFEVVPRSLVKQIDEVEELSLLKALHKKSAVVESLEQFAAFLAKLLE